MRFGHLISTGLCFGALLLGSSSKAFATPITGQISVSGYAESNTGSMGTATGINFANAAGTSVSGNFGYLSSYGAGTGSFAALGGCSSTTTGCGTIQDIATFSTEGATPSFLTLNTRTSTAVSFDLSSITNVVHAPNMTGGSVTFTALGTINFTGYNSTPGQFILTAQGNDITSFSATTLATSTTTQVTPEPASFALLGTGLLSAAFAKFRRKQRFA